MCRGQSHRGPKGLKRKLTGRRASVTVVTSIGGPLGFSSMTISCLGARPLEGGDICVSAGRLYSAVLPYFWLLLDADNPK